MADVRSFANRPLSNRNATLRIRSFWKDGEVTFVPHAVTAMEQRGISMLDIEHVVLRTGHVTDSSRPGQHWRYVLEGRTAEGRKLRVVLELNGRLVIVTAVRPSR